MGQFHVFIDAVGAHGCQREVKDGGAVYGCGQMSCPDCRTREFLETLRRTGASVSIATLTHWPGTPTEVKDDLISKRRTGSF